MAQKGGASNHLPYAELRREADLALRRRGDTRSAAIHAGLASESLLDYLLMHLMWEEGRRPEAAAAIWRDTLMKRVRAEFAPRIGGIWTTDRSGPVGNWADKVVDLRNSAVHAAYLPSRQEAEESLSALEELVVYLNDLLSEAAAAGRYPRVAHMFVARDGFERRGRVVPDSVEAVLADPGETVWREVTARWIETFRRARRDRRSDRRRVPRLEESDLVAIVHQDDTIQWVAVHSRSHLAATIDHALIDAAPTGRLLELIKSLPASRDCVSIQLIGDPVPRTASPQWLEVYRLLPGSAVMVDHSDLDCGHPPRFPPGLPVEG